MKQPFSASLPRGRVGESRIAQWFISQGFSVFPASVMPAYEKERSTYKGPRLFTPTGELILPDLFVMRQGPPHPVAAFIEVKTKSAFSLHRNSNRWVTGIDRNVYEDYLRIDQTTPFRVMLMFLQEVGSDPHSPPPDPRNVGLFGERISVLSERINHRCDPCQDFPSGGVFWARESLSLFATLEDLAADMVCIALPTPEVAHAR